MAFFLEFTTGARHPLSLVHTVPLPIFDCGEPEAEVFGDYILVTERHESMGRSALSVVSWKTGKATEVSRTFESVQCHPNFEQSSTALSTGGTSEGFGDRPGQ